MDPHPSMVEDQDPNRRKAEQFHADLTEAMSCIVDYQRSLATLTAADPHRPRTNPLMEKYGVPLEQHPHNHWPGRNGTISVLNIT
jgi:hypothetical protein